MWQARKALDLQRDPRFALHSGSDDPPGWDGRRQARRRRGGDHRPGPDPAINGAKAPGPSHLFRLDLHEVSTVGLNAAGDQLVIEVWTAAAASAGSSAREGSQGSTDR